MFHSCRVAEVTRKEEKEKKEGRKEGKKKKESDFIFNNTVLLI